MIIFIFLKDSCKGQILTALKERVRIASTFHGFDKNLTTTEPRFDHNFDQNVMASTYNLQVEAMKLWSKGWVEDKFRSK